MNLDLFWKQSFLIKLTVDIDPILGLRFFEFPVDDQLRFFRNFPSGGVGEAPHARARLEQAQRQLLNVKKG
jgi:hypothetical protein